jgi:erythromycin esterase-like protein
MKIVPKKYFSHVIYFAAFVFCVNSLAAQEAIKNYVKNNAIPIATIEPDSINYDDLQKIGEAIGDARIVMLGEQDHGDAPTFSAKTRLIKYLHEKRGFNVVAFESDFFALNYEWDRLLKNDKASVFSFLDKSIYALWTRCDACQPLFKDYIPQTLQSSNPLQISGFDNQVAVPFLVKMLDSTIRSLNLSIVSFPNYSKEIIPLLQTGGNARDTSLNNNYLRYLAEIKKQLIDKLNVDDFWVQVVDNLITENLEYQALKSSVYAIHMNIRDERMALNLKWLASIKYPKEKIIVWAHNGHVSKYAGHYPEKPFNSLKTMGTVFTSDSIFMKQTYILGFTSYEGTTGRLYGGKVYEVTKPERNSLENWVASKYDFAFVDFKQFNLLHPDENENFNMSGATKGNLYHKNAKAQWNKVFDGVFFIRHMYPCEPAKE